MNHQENLAVGETQLVKSSAHFLWALFVPIFLFNITSFWGSSFTADPNINVGIKYAYVLGKAGLAILFIGILLNSRFNSFAVEHLVGRPSVRKESGLDLLLILRAFACLLVICGHFFCQVFMVEGFHEITLRNHLVQLFMVSPWIGVWIFFSLSGYLMGKGFFSGRYQLIAQDIRRFFANRALRIIPIYVLAVLVVALLMHPQIFALNNAWMLAQILLFDFKGDLPINPIGALWSVSTEFQFYLMVPFLAAAIYGVHKRFSHTGVMIGSLLVAGLVFRIVMIHRFEDGWYSLIYTPFWSNVDIFLSGMLLSKLVADRKNKPLRAAKIIWGENLTALALLGAVVVACEILATRIGMPRNDMNKVLLTTSAFPSFFTRARTFD